MARSSSAADRFRMRMATTSGVAVPCAAKATTWVAMAPTSSWVKPSSPEAAPATVGAARMALAVELGA